MWTVVCIGFGFVMKNKLLFLVNVKYVLFNFIKNVYVLNVYFLSKYLLLYYLDYLNILFQFWQKLWEKKTSRESLIYTHKSP